MTLTAKLLIGLLALALALLLVRALADILTPFLIAFGLAYILDPAASRLARLGAGRGTAAGVVTCGFFALLLGGLVLMAPTIQAQLAALIDQLMILGDRVEDALKPFIRRMIQEPAAAAPAQGDAPAATVSGEVVKQVIGWTGTVLGGLWAGGIALFGLVSVLVIAPVVVFYLLRDWPQIVARLELWVPPRHMLVTRELLQRIDSRLSGFLRGQALVCLVLGLIYAAGLALVGLNSGIVLGLVAGIVSFIPYVGTLSGFVVGMGLALIQFDTIPPVIAVAAVFGVGQFIEGMILTPYLVGGRVGLHPVWVIFALLAGGALFGFVGVLLAVPVAAALGVLVEYFVQRYLQSSFYTRTEG